MALGDYILCCECECKLIYDGDRGQRKWWHDRWGKDPQIKCPDCEQPAQDQPVGEVECIDWDEDGQPSAWFKLYNEVRLGDKLYTRPPKREWVGLTDEEILEVWCIHLDEGDEDEIEEWRHVINEAREIEAKLREKNT